ncbi:uncharacterized protein B0H64DRAFT_29579 [Chaetomium fimeti]|uniref:Uncharacterized protein n=1 Tax=Chaetomium fimeti TaxID=1854472 RepID=A0AAE0LXC5_9PEZI|nr:hypothetical protein B0H64DRAFT_29579 [Chaetomium fimeti]
MHSTGSVCGERWQGPRGRRSRWALPRDKRTLGLPELSLQQAREHTAGEINSGKGRKRNRAGVGPGVTENDGRTSPINALPPAPAAPVSDGRSFLTSPACRANKKQTLTSCFIWSRKPLVPSSDLVQSSVQLFESLSFIIRPGYLPTANILYLAPYMILAGRRDGCIIKLLSLYQHCFCTFPVPFYPPSARPVDGYPRSAISGSSGLGPSVKIAAEQLPACHIVGFEPSVPV